MRSPRRLAEQLLRGADGALRSEVEDVLHGVEDVLADLLSGAGMPAGFDPERYLAPGVPRLRTVLLVLAERAAGGRCEGALEVALVAELLHLAVRVHDTALGRRGGRRRRVARRLLGGAVHWLGGNHLTLRALELVRTAPAPDLLSEVIDTLREVADAHALAEELRGRPATVGDWRQWAEDHHGALHAFCTRAGARLAGAPAGTVSALGRYGRHLGIAWQATEDLWLVEGASRDEFLGALAERWLAGHPHLPLAHAMEADPGVEALLGMALRLEGEAACEGLREALRATGGVAGARRVVVEQALAARRALSQLPDTPARRALHQVAGELVGSGARQAAAGEAG